MKYRAPTQLHASLYMGDKQKSTDSRVGKETKAGKSISNKKAGRAKK
ncbi:MAG: hypothetical protein GY774_18880 [Planctomycetes bacterium]|nr:hypothetical protein [Planctomycetota bacterium]